MRAARCEPGARSRAACGDRRVVAGWRRRTTAPRRGCRTTTKNPSPVVPTSSPSCEANDARRVSSCHRSSSSHASSPIASARFVDFTMSVNMNVFSTRRSGPAFPRSCQGRSASTSSITIASVGHDTAAARNSSSSTLSGSMTSAFPRSPFNQSKAVGATVMQFPAPMHLWRSTRARSMLTPPPLGMRRPPPPRATTPRSSRTSPRAAARRRPRPPRARRRSRDSSALR